MTDYSTKYARSLKRNYEDKNLSYKRRMEDSGFQEGTPDMERAMQQMQKAGNNYPPDIPKLISLRDAKESPPGGSKPPSNEIGAFEDLLPKRDFSKMQFLDEGIKKGGKIDLKNCKVSTHVPSKKHGNW